MRLTRFQIDAIIRLAREKFGDESKVSLFGSRTDDRKKGGDIDLFISNIDAAVLTIEAKARFLAALKAEIGDRKIDVVFDDIPTRGKMQFYRSIIRQKVDLQ